MRSLTSGFAKKLLASMLFVGLAPLLLTSWLLTDTSSSGLERQVFSQLDSVREIRRKQVEDYFGMINAQIVTMAENSMVIEATQDFIEGFTALNPAIKDEDVTESVKRYYQQDFGKTYQESTQSSADINALLPISEKARYAQYLYLSENSNPLGEKHRLYSADDGSKYSASHQEYHSQFRNFLEKFGYYDIFLVDMDQGHVVYSVFKEIDYATSLKQGPHKDSGLAQAYKAALGIDKGETRILDFKPYLPSYEAAASFISSPVYISDKQVGVLIFQMPVDRINAITSDSTGLGETGETYLMGNDLLMRSQSRFIDSATLGVLKADTEAVRAAIKGETGNKIIQDYRNIEVLSSYSPLAIDGLKWGILAEIDKTEAFQTIDKLFMLSSVMAAVCVLGVVILSWLIIRGTMKQLGADPEELGKVAKAIADDQLDIELDDQGAVGVYYSMSEMRSKLQLRIEAERAAAAENTRIKTAVDNATNNILFADDNLEITYSNGSFLRFMQYASHSIKEVVPDFDPDKMFGSTIDTYHPDPKEYRSELLSLTETGQFDAQFGSLHVRISATPVFNDQGNRIGTVTEWSDRTQQVKTEQEIQEIVHEAQLGNLSQRISMEGKQDFFMRLSEGVNHMIAVCDQAINDTVAAISALSRGDLSHTIQADYEGAFGLLKEGVNETSEKLTQAMAKIMENAETVSSSSKDIAAGNLDLSNRTEQQAANLEETASNMDEMNSTVRQNTDNAVTANQLAQQTREQAVHGGQVVESAVTAMAEITESSNKISEITSVIDEIAFQTNLLALNASVEAARAGEAGRGFAVVADEVRTLASRSALAAREIKDLIEDSVLKVGQGTKLVDQSGQSLSSIVDSVSHLSRIISEISNASQEQNDGIGQVNLAVSEMDQMTQQNAAMVEEAAAAAQSLSDQANDLRELVGFFQLGEREHNAGNEFELTSNQPQHFRRAS